MTVSDYALLPADQLADGLVVSAVAAVQTVVVDWTTGGGVVRCHCKTETMKAQQSFQGNHMASIKVMLYVKNGLVPHAFAPKNCFEKKTLAGLIKVVKQ